MYVYIYTQTHADTQIQRHRYICQLQNALLKQLAQSRENAGGQKSGRKMGGKTGGCPWRLDGPLKKKGKARGKAGSYC